MRMTLTRRRTRRLLHAAVLAALALPAAADAATVELIDSGGNGVIAYNGEPGEANSVRVLFRADGVLIGDSAPLRTKDSECRILSSGDAVCPGTADSVLVFTGDGNDTIQYRAPHPGFVSGGNGFDTIFAGLRESGFGRQIEPVIYRGNDSRLDSGNDTVSYRFADRGVHVDLGVSQPTDGRPGIDREQIESDIEQVEGSDFDDVLFGGTGNDFLQGLKGTDTLAGGDGADVIDERDAANGADFVNGGNGPDDRVLYSGRPSGVTVSLDGVRNDGQPGENDDVRPSIEHVHGTQFRDVLTGNGSANELFGLAGNDTISGLGGNDTLTGGAGNNGLAAGPGNDVILARNGAFDTIDCGTETDTLERDADEPSGAGCERVQVGVLRLAPKAVGAEAGKRAVLRLSWRHPQGWRKLRSVELRLTRGQVVVGQVTIRPPDGRIVSGGAITVERKHSRLSRTGKLVSARLAIRIDKRLAGQTLEAEVEATDRSGARQLERNAGTVTVAQG